MKIQSTIKGIAALLLVLTLQACDLPTEDPATFGSWAVGHTTFDAIDSERDNRTLLVDIWFPVDAENALTSITREGFPDLVYPKTTYPLLGSFGIEAEISRDKQAQIVYPQQSETDWDPSSQRGRALIIFSHGYGGTNTQSTVLMETLASHGFIVIAPEHTGNTALGEQDPFDIVAANRVPDISFLIDTMLARNADPQDSLFERINPHLIGVVGHSFGGTTALGSVAGFGGAAGDPRVKAVVPISAVVDGSFTIEQLNSITVPVMLIGGTLDSAVPIENNALAYDSIIGPSPVYRADIIGARHAHFANVCAIGNWLIGIGFQIEQWAGLGAAALTAPYMDTCGPDELPITEATRLQNLYTVAFFRRHLYYEFGYWRYLNPSYSEVFEPNVIYSTKNNIEPLLMSMAIQSKLNAVIEN